jgi:hypothetical protein
MYGDANTACVFDRSPQSLQSIGGNFNFWWQRIRPTRDVFAVRFLFDQEREGSQVVEGPRKFFWGGHLFLQDMQVPAV